jgi:uncharacterized protein with GYD domain
MPTYGLLMKWTEQGVKDIKDSPRRLAEGAKACEAAGGKNVKYWVTMGDYDILGIADLPNDEAAALVAFSLSSLGNVRTTSFRMFTPEEFDKTVKMLP